MICSSFEAENLSYLVIPHWPVLEDLWSFRELNDTLLNTVEELQSKAKQTL